MTKLEKLKDSIEKFSCAKHEFKNLKTAYCNDWERLTRRTRKRA